MNQSSHAASILYHILQRANDDHTMDWHAVYLSMRILSKMLEEKLQQLQLLSTQDHEQLSQFLLATEAAKNADALSSVLSYFGWNQSKQKQTAPINAKEMEKQIVEMQQFRKAVMQILCAYNPENHLYRMWSLYWNKTETQLGKNDVLLEEEMTPDEIVQHTVSYLQQIITEKTPKEEEEELQRFQQQQPLEPARATPVSLQRRQQSMEKQVSLYATVVSWLRQFFGQNGFVSIILVALSAAGYGI